MTSLSLAFTNSRRNEIFTFFELLKHSQNKKILIDFIGLINSNVEIEQVDKFVDDFYVKRKIDIEKIISETEFAWNKKKFFFERQINELFSFSFKKSVSAMPSIWPIYGRFFQKNLVTFPYDKKLDERLFVIVHELLHLVFYEYISTKYKFSEEKILSQEVWVFSEIINVLIQNKADWFNEFKVRAVPYTEHLLIYEKMSVDWKRKNDVDYLIKKFLISNKEMTNIV